MKPAEQGKKRGRALWIILLILFGAVFVYSGLKFLGIMTEYKEGVDIYEEVRESYGIKRETSGEISREDREKAAAAASREAEREQASKDAEEGIPADEEEGMTADEGVADPEDQTPEGRTPENESPDAESTEGSAAEEEAEDEAPENESAEESGSEDEDAEDTESEDEDTEPEDEDSGETKPEEESARADAGEDDAGAAAEEDESAEAEAEEEDAEPVSEAEAETEPEEPKEPAKYWIRPYVKDYSGYENPEKLPFLHTTIDYLLIPPYIFDFDALTRLNPDVCGWIMIEGTYVDYPMVQGADNVFYLRHAVSGAMNNAGSVFVDYRHKEPFYERNTLVYAHNQRNLRMFHQVLSYQEKAYLDEHPYVYVYLPDGSMQYYRVYSCHVETGTDSYLIHFADDEAFMKFVKYTQEASLWDSGVSIFPDSRILTLVTCTDEADEKRVVLHAVLVDQIAPEE